MEITNKHGIHQALYNAIVNANGEYDFKDEPYKVSVTGLIGPPAIRKLRMKYGPEIKVDAMSMVWQLLGTVLHGILDKSGDGYNTEERNIIQVGKWTVSGKHDLYDEKSQELVDYKFVSGSVIMYNPKGKPEWHQQLNVLRQVLIANGKPVKSMKIIAIVRDWTKRSAFTAQMPDNPIVPISIPVWDDDIAMQYITNRLTVFEQYEQDNIIPICNMDERWQKPPQFAVKKIGSSRAVNGGIKNSRIEAEAFMREKGYTDRDYDIEERPSIPTRCLDYCEVNKFCSFYINNVQSDHDTFEV